jgi:hypothetical protein
MTAELERNFFDMATVEQEIRQDIARYELEKLTPLDVAVRIRTHPSLSITSKLKMQRAVTCQASYSERFVQTIHFDPQDGETLKNNLKAARSLLGRASRRSQALERNGSIVLRDVPVDWILEFLAAYTPHERGSTVRTDLLTKYIIAQNERTTTGPGLRLWNVVAIGNDKNDYGDIDLGLPRRMNMVNRSQLNLPQADSIADIKALISRSDLLEDLELAHGVKKELISAGFPAIMRFRTEGLPDRGMLALYPINRTSAPAGRIRTSPTGVQSRRALNAVEDVLGMALAFPKSNDLAPQEYLSVDLSGVKREDIEWIE